MTTVYGLIHGGKGTYGISFPDFPGLASGGANLVEVEARGREGLATHIEALIAEGIPVPHPRNLDELRGDADLAEDFSDAVLVLAVDVDLPTKAVRLNITLDEGLLARIDRQAARLGESRSGFLASAARARLAG